MTKIMIFARFCQERYYFLQMQKQDDNWLPLQSNPEVMNGFIKQLGLNTQIYAVQDLFSTQQWALQMLGQPVLGIIFLFQINQLQKQFQRQQKANLQANHVSDNVFFMKQYAKNACGTIALFHIILNAIYDYPDLVRQDSYLTKFTQQNFGKTPAEIGQSFKTNKQICQKHKDSVKKGQTKVQSKVQTHFIAFVEKDGCVYQLDGRKSQPINHGECVPGGLASASCKVISRFMARDPENNKFTLLALGRRNDF